MKLFLTELPERLDPSALALVSPERQERIGRFLRPKDKLRCLTAGLQLQWLLGASAKELRRGPCGKPYLPDGAPEFNLSHGGNYVVLAADTQQVGVDVEEIRPFSPGLIDRALTVEERMWLEAQPEPENFFRLWTGKESVMKACGLGLSLSPASFSVLPMQNGCHTIRGEQWHLNWYERKDCVVCVCARSAVRAEVELLPWQQLTAELQCR